MEEKFNHLIKKLLTNEITVTERQELTWLLSENEELQELYQTLYAAQTQEKEEDKTVARQAYAAHFARMQAANVFQGLEKKTSEAIVIPFYRRKIVAWAAAVLLVVSSVSLYYWQQGLQKGVEQVGNIVSTRKGSKSQIVLPDGTKVWLNADSKLTYKGDFTTDLREITLTGEAFFEVAKDKGRPFIIHTPAVDIKVLGTTFNVRSYPHESTTETALIEGKIEVTLNQQGNNKIVLKPSEKLIVSNKVIPAGGKRKANDESTDTPMLTVSSLRYSENDSLPTEAYWMQNKLAFDNEAFEKVASKIERWYNVEIVFINDNIRQKRFTGFFEANTLQEVMEALRLSGGINYEIKGEKVVVK